ncbi:MAG: ABC transporter ATP-binding protein [Myxococcales bacterium]|nr:ABC transporter ATP-binding protein [Myxococcales bacterium]MBL0197381.1 ABC transporter ATP-binding protein [Myxococcales bacterium]
MAEPARPEVVLSVSKLSKTFKKPFSGKKVHAVKEVSFEVRRGEIFGFLGPNGAGKTTTIKMLTGLISPTGGRASLLGLPVPSSDAMGRVGFLPENPYVYPYLTPREFVTLAGRLNDVPGRTLQKRVPEVLDRVGVLYAIDRAVRALSKGMLQRVGLAAALIHDPEMLILDEPMSGLDPVGRKEVRDLILDEQRGGRTVLFSSHILSDVEMLCDRVSILKKGEVVVAGTMRELLGESGGLREITLGDASDALLDALRTSGFEPRSLGRSWALQAEGDDRVRAVLEAALEANARVESVVAHRETLEDIFVRRAI